MATVYTDTATQAYALQARTDAAGAAVDDVTGEDLRLVAQLFEPGVVMSPADSWQVKQRAAGANMSVDVGSGDPDTDLAVVAGIEAGQGNYLIRRAAATVNVTVPAANLSNPRIDQVFLVVQDNAYDASARVLPRIAYRDGTPAGSPVAPGPDAAWRAYLLLAEILIPAGDTAITDSQITDQRAAATLAAEALGDHAATHATDGADSLAGLLDGFVEFGAISDSPGTAISESAYSTTLTQPFVKPASWNSYVITLFAVVNAQFIGTANGDLFNQWLLRARVAAVVVGEANQGQVDVKVTNGYGASLVTGSVGGSLSGLTADSTLDVGVRSFPLANFSGFVGSVSLFWFAVRTS